MKHIFRLSLIGLLAFASLQARAIVGYYNYTFYHGANLFENGLLANNNHLSAIFPAVPEGTMVSLWDPAANAYGTTAIYDPIYGGWVDPVFLTPQDLELLPGTGARLTSPSLSPFINSFVGEVVMRDGGPFHDAPFPGPPVFSGPDGTYLLGDIMPMASTGTAVFTNILGRLPNIGEQFTRLDAATQTYITSTYLGAGGWDNTEPSIGVGEAAFFTIPEPSVIALSLLGLLMARSALRRKAWQNPPC